jgi:hypothetical protein
MTMEWHELTRITRGLPFVVERIRLVQSGVAIEGSFELPPLARLSAEDQVFVMAFVRSDGSIKDMEQIFGISYPTVKNRLNRIAEQLEFVEISPPPSHDDILTQLEHGEISAAEAIERLSQ